MEEEDGGGKGRDDGKSYDNRMDMEARQMKNEAAEAFMTFSKCRWSSMLRHEALDGRTGGGR